MTATKTSRTGTLVAAILLGGSVVLNIYLWRRSERVGTGRGAAVPGASAKASPATKAEAGYAGLITLDFANDADLVTLRDALYAAGATETRARQIIYGVLRRHYRQAVTDKRLASIGRGWWRDETRTLGITRASASLRDENVLLKQHVDNQIERLFGLDPTQVAVVNARYSYLPEAMRMKLARLERERQLPGQWVPTGDPEVDAKMEAEWAKLLKETDGEKQKMLASLTPEQRREYDLRYGQLGMRLANEYRSVPDGTEEEFRKLYRIAEAYANPSPNTAVSGLAGAGLVTVAAGTTSLGWSTSSPVPAGSGGLAATPAPAPASVAETNQRIVNQVVAELGSDRAMEYLWAGTQEYRAIAMLGQQISLPPATASRYAQLAAETGQKANAIHRDASLNVDQRRAALITLQQSARAQVDALVPTEAQQRLPAAGTAWLNALSTGSYRMLSAGVPGRGSSGSIVASITANALTPPPSFVVPSVTLKAGN